MPPHIINFFNKFRDFFHQLIHEPVFLKFCYYILGVTKTHRTHGTIGFRILHCPKIQIPHVFVSRHTHIYHFQYQMRQSDYEFRNFLSFIDALESPFIRNLLFYLLAESNYHSFK